MRFPRPFGCRDRFHLGDRDGRRLDAEHDLGSRDVADALGRASWQVRHGGRESACYRNWVHIVGNRRDGKRNKACEDECENARPCQCLPEHGRGTLQDRFHNVSIS